MRKHFKLIGMSLVLCGLVSFSSCSKDDDDDDDNTNPTPTTVNVTGVGLNKSTTSIAVGATETLQATVAPSNATNKSITWTSSNTGIATVNNGVVTGVAAGSAYVKVTTVDGSKKDSCQVTVTGGGSPTAVITMQLAGFPQWTANYMDGQIGSNDGFMIQASSGSSMSTYPNITFSGKAEVNEEGYYWVQTYQGFQYVQAGFITYEGDQYPDWIHAYQQGAGSSIQVVVTQVDMANLLISGTISGSLWNTQDDIDGIDTEKQLTGTFSNVSLTRVAKKSANSMKAIKSTKFVKGINASVFKKIK